MSRLAGKVAIITGAAQGMGAAHAQEFIKQGAKLFVRIAGIFAYHQVFVVRH